MTKRKICFIMGTRPEAIKMAPISKLFLNDKTFDIINVSTGQHLEMLYQVLDVFGVRIDVELSVMKPDQTLSYLSSTILEGLSKVLIEKKPDMVIVQGDTTTAHMGALAAFYQKIPVAHIEAGLRSFDLHSPFPEEANRKIISQLAKFHFCPTDSAVENLKAEGIISNVFKVGNTVVDALFDSLNIIRQSRDIPFEQKFSYLADKKFLLITGHRRESFGNGFLNICNALKRIAEKFPYINIFYPVHLNPGVQKPVYSILKGIDNIYLSSPLNYLELIQVLDKSHMVLTDSGGIQEEAPSLGKPVLVMREVTERMEGITAGNAILVGTTEESIFNWTSKLLTDPDLFNSMSTAGNPYGDGKASQRILEIIKKEYQN